MVALACLWIYMTSDLPTAPIVSILITLTVFDTVLILVMANRLGKNIRVLHDFTLRAGKDKNFVPTASYSNDELGEIVRQIMDFYNERVHNSQKLKREHAVAIQALEDKVRLKHELTNNLNHNLKTPVCVIKGYVDTILQHPEMDEESKRRFLIKINENIGRLTQILNDLSNITRLDFGSKMINTEPVDFHEIVYQAVSEYENSGLLNNMDFDFDIPTSCSVVGNTALLRTILNNLTKNAVSYSGGTSCNLVYTGKDDYFYHFAFYDNGVGVKEENLPMLFDRFFRGDEKNTIGKNGTGLGLPIVQSSITALGGNITVANRDGGGLIFRFTLQRAK